MQSLKKLFCVLLIVLLMAPALGLAEKLHEEMKNDALSVDVTAGYDGMMTYGRVMPIFIRVENKGADLEGRICVNVYANRRQYNRYEMEFSLAAGAVKDVRLPVRVGSKQDTFTVEIWQGDEKVCAVNASPSRFINPSAMMVGVLSDQPQSLTYLDVDNLTDTLMRNEFIKTVPLTAETFPDSMDLMRSFGMVVIDGYDVSLLSASQKQTLMNWLELGHVLVLGGGAGAGAVWPAFTEQTGLAFTQVEMQPDQTGALLHYLGVTGESVGKSVMLAMASGGETLIEGEDMPLIWRSNAGEGVIYTSAFSLSDKALSNWTPMHTFFQRLMIKDCYTLYRQGFETSEISESYFGTAGGLPIDNDVPMLTAALLAAAILVLGGCAAYFLLKRMDRRQLLWLILPLLSLAAVTVVTVLGVSSAAARPTVLAVTVLKQSADGAQSRITSLVAGTPERSEQMITLEKGSLIPQDYDDWYYDEESKALPTTLKNRYLIGDQSSLGVTFAWPWATGNFMVKDLPVPSGNIDAALWMEDDGLHGYLVNNTELTLDAGVFCCKYGYCSVPALKSGERFDLYLKRAKFVDTNKSVYDDGSMYESLAGSSFSAYSMVYEYYFKTSQQKNGAVDWENRDTSKADMMAQVMNRFSNGSSYYYNVNEKPRFYYAAYTDGLSIPQVYVNGQTVTRVGERALVCVEMPFVRHEGSDLIYRVPGMDEAVRCQVNENGVPFYNPALPVNNSSYHQVNEQPVFMFQVEEAAGAKIERLVFYSEYIPKQVQAYLYNGSGWTQYTMGQDAGAPDRFVDDEGRVFIQFRPVLETESYHEVYTPTMLLEGRVN